MERLVSKRACIGAVDRHYCSKPWVGIVLIFCFACSSFHWNCSYRPQCIPFHSNPTNATNAAYAERSSQRGLDTATISLPARSLGAWKTRAKGALHRKWHIHCELLYISFLKSLPQIRLQINLSHSIFSSPTHSIPRPYGLCHLCGSYSLAGMHGLNFTVRTGLLYIYYAPTYARECFSS